MVWPFKKKNVNASPVYQGSSAWRVLEPFTGAWQRNIEWTRESVLAHHAVFSCISLISSDIAKLKPRVVRKDSAGVWSEIPYGRHAVLQKPNSYQTRIQFYEGWVLSKLIRGNAYIYKERNNRGDVVEMHVLHPDLVTPLVSDDGQVFYRLSHDNLAGIGEVGITIPASEIIHDRFNCFFHPLVGLSPLFASGLPAFMGQESLSTSAKLFVNGSRPNGILTVPEAITDEQAQEMMTTWESKYGGKNTGKTAILGGSVKYQPIATTAVENQMVELLKMTAEMVCSTFHVPAYKVIGNAPSYNNVEALDRTYYSQCLQVLIESMEECLDAAFGMVGSDTGVEFDVDNLMRMDTKSQLESLAIGVGSAIYAPNEARLRMNMPPVEGGESPMIQQQNYSLAALAKRDAQDDPFAGEEVIDVEPEETPQEDIERQFLGLSLKIRNGLKGVKYDA